LLRCSPATPNIGTTANIYAHLDTTDLETALKALDEIRDDLSESSYRKPAFCADYGGGGFD